MAYFCRLIEVKAWDIRPPGGPGGCTTDCGDLTNDISSSTVKGRYLGVMCISILSKSNSNSDIATLYEHTTACAHMQGQEIHR
jgi:hypothetical protein